MDEIVEVHVEDTPDEVNSDNHTDVNYDPGINEDMGNKSGDSDMDSESGGSDENGSNNNDEKYVIAGKNIKQFKSTIIDLAQGYDTPYSSD